jgi:hypothetical protein
MGRGLAWFTVKSASLADITTALDVKATGRRGPPEKFPLAARQLAEGHWLLVSRNCDEPLFATKYLAVVSRKGQIFSGMFEEHVMASAFAAWGKGRKAWSVRHQGDDDPLHLKTTGKLPPHIAALKDAALEKQRGEGDEAEQDHLYELSLELVKPHTGLDPDDDFDDGEFAELSIGFWRGLWRRTYWWRLLFLFLAGTALFVWGIGLLTRLLNWLLELLGWR